MEKEVYSCLKMMEAFDKILINIYRLEGSIPIDSIIEQYGQIRGRLYGHLSENQINSIPIVSTTSTLLDLGRQKEKIKEIGVATKVAIAYLRSLDMDLEKELEERKRELNQREKELDEKEKWIDKMSKPFKMLPELARSRVQEETKRSHRGIEKHSRKPIIAMKTKKK